MTSSPPDENREYIKALFGHRDFAPITDPDPDGLRQFARDLFANADD